MMSFLLVFVGAGIGGALRHGVNLLAARALGYGFPFGTLIVNVGGSFLMGILAAYFVQKTGVSQHWKLFLTSGLLGGFTTFSAFSIDAALLYEKGSYGALAAYIATSVLLSIAALFAGLALFRLAGAP